MNMKLKKFVVLLVEDSPTDILMITEGFKCLKTPHTMHVVQDGEEALQFLYGEGQYAGRPLPNLILLDLNLPKKNGWEVLQEIKTDANYLHIPVVVLTTSQNKKDFLMSYDLHANCAISKPVTLTNFIAIAEAIEKFWFTHVSLPVKSTVREEA